MATADPNVIPAIVKAGLEEELYQDNIWMQLAADESSQLSDGGNSISFVSDATTYSTTNVPKTEFESETLADHVRPTPSVASLSVLTAPLDQYEELSLLVTQAQSLLTRTSLATRVISDTARAFRNKMNAYIRGRLDAVTGASQMTAVPTAAASWGNAAHLTAIREAFRNAKVSMDYAHIPMMGRIAVVSPAVSELLAKYFEENKITFQNNINELAVQMGSVMMLSGFSIVVDNSLPEGRTATDDANHTMYFMVPGMGLTVAVRVQDLVLFDPHPTYRGAVVDGFWGYMSVVNQPSRVRIVKHNIT